jgi:hypothetical protein
MSNLNKTPRPKNRRWTLGKKVRCCGNYNCEGYDTPNSPFVLDAETGIVKTTCKLCGEVTERQCDDWKERRPCENPKCGWVRAVAVRYFSGTISWKRFCDACETEAAVRSHLHQASALKDKADAIRKARLAKPRLAADADLSIES